MKFKQFAPSIPYSKFIAYFWTLESSIEQEAELRYRFVPDGYVDWIFHLGTPWNYRFPDSTIFKQASQSHVFGQIKRYLDLQLPSEKLKLFGVKFYPWVADKIWQTDMHYHTDQCTPITNLELNNITFLQEEIYYSNDTCQRIKLIEDFLSSYLNILEKESLEKVLFKINSMPLDSSFKELGIGNRRLEQRFRNEIGISPKRFARTIRINKLIKQLKEKGSRSLTSLAYDFGYYDQSHFIRDFKQFTGLSPTRFLDSINPSGDIFNLRI